MRFLVLLFVVAVGYLLYMRAKPAPSAAPAAVVSSVPAEPTPEHSNALKRPIDRTREVLKGVEKRNAEGF